MRVEAVTTITVLIKLVEGTLSDEVIKRISQIYLSRQNELSIENHIRFLNLFFIFNNQLLSNVFVELIKLNLTAAVSVLDLDNFESFLNKKKQSTSVLPLPIY